MHLFGLQPPHDRKLRMQEHGKPDI